MSLVYVVALGASAMRAPICQCFIPSPLPCWRRRRCLHIIREQRECEEKFKRHKTASRESWQTSISRLKECVDHPRWLNVSSTREFKNRKNLWFNDDDDRSEIHRFDILHTIVTFGFSRATRIARFFDTHRRALISLDFLDQSLGRIQVGVKSRDQRIVYFEFVLYSKCRVC